jgi:hypothetical protein
LKNAQYAVLGKTSTMEAQQGPALGDNAGQHKNR